MFFALSTQWRVGMGGLTGLDYNALPALFSLLGIKKKSRRELFFGLREMERAALNVWADQRENAE